MLSTAKLIAEPWDIGPGGYRLGEFPNGWGEWNDHFRDASRKFWRGDARMRGALATRLSGSQDVFHAAPDAGKTVNFVIAHDGFTLADLVSYAHKHNDANGEGNRDGTNDNLSWSHGVEGETQDARILAARSATSATSWRRCSSRAGAPMFTAGAEIGHSQRGNNNAYSQDNEISWLDWSKADGGLAVFVGRLAALRAAHPALRQAAWLNGEPIAHGEPLDVEWRDAELPFQDAGHWESPYGAVLTAVFAAQSGADIDRVLVAFNRGRRLRCGCRLRVRASSGASRSTPATICAPTPAPNSPTARR